MSSWSSEFRKRCLSEPSRRAILIPLSRKLSPFQSPGAVAAAAAAAAYWLRGDGDRRLFPGISRKTESTVASGSCIVHDSSPHLSLPHLVLITSTAFLTEYCLTRAIYGIWKTPRRSASGIRQASKKSCRL